MLMTKTRVALALLVLSGVATAQTADPAAGKAVTPDDREKAMSSAFAQLAPLQTRVAEAALELQLQVAARPETATRIAAFKKNLFDALRREGFTADQALQIVIETPLPSPR